MHLSGIDTAPVYRLFSRHEKQTQKIKYSYSYFVVKGDIGYAVDNPVLITLHPFYHFLNRKRQNPNTIKLQIMWIASNLLLHDKTPLRKL